jgi:hypothetical protein
MELREGLRNKWAAPGEHITLEPGDVTRYQIHFWETADMHIRSEVGVAVTSGVAKGGRSFVMAEHSLVQGWESIMGQDVNERVNSPIVQWGAGEFDINPYTMAAVYQAFMIYRSGEPSRVPKHKRKAMMRLLTDVEIPFQVEYIVHSRGTPEHIPPYSKPWEYDPGSDPEVEIVRVFFDYKDELVELPETLVPDTLYDVLMEDIMKEEELG